MTKNEAILISAYTGFLLTKDFNDVLAFCEELLGRQVFSHELAKKEVVEEIRKRCEPMIIAIVENEKDGDSDD